MIAEKQYLLGADDGTGGGQAQVQRQRPQFDVVFRLALVASCMALCLVFAVAVAISLLPSSAAPALSHRQVPPTPLTLQLFESEAQALNTDVAQIDEATTRNHSCATLPQSRALLHQWLEAEAHESVRLMHSVAASLSLLLLRNGQDTAMQSEGESAASTTSLCRLATHSREVRASDLGVVEQSGLYFDERAQSFWTMQRRLERHRRRHRHHGSTEEAVWLPQLDASDCLVCSSEADCAGQEKAEEQLRKTMAHAPEGWCMVHLHECQEGQAEFKHKHPRPQRWKNECKATCAAAENEYAEDRQQHIDGTNAWLSCQVCQSINAQVDAAADIEIDPTTIGKHQLQRMDEMLSALFQPTHVKTAKLTDTAEAPLLGPFPQQLNAFFLDWSSQLAGASQLLQSTLHEPERLRNLFADSHREQSNAAAQVLVFAQAEQRPFRHPRQNKRHGTANVSELYELDAEWIQRHLDRVATEMAAQKREATRLRMGGGSGGGMGLQLQCVGPDGRASLPLLTLGGGGGNGFRSMHVPRSVGNSTFKGGAGGGAGLQSWGVLAAEGGSLEDGLSVGGGGGGGLNMHFSHQFAQIVELKHGRVVSHSHGASPDDLIALPPEHAAANRREGTLADFPKALAREMRRCMAAPGLKLRLQSSGGAGGGMQLSLSPLQTTAAHGASTKKKQKQPTAAPTTPNAEVATVKLHHSVNFRLEHEFGTCGWPKSLAPCAKRRAFPGRAAPPAASLTDLSSRHRSHNDLDDEADATPRLHLARPVPRADDPWSRSMHRQLAACMEKSHELSRDLMGLESAAGDDTDDDMEENWEEEEEYNEAIGLQSQNSDDGKSENSTSVSSEPTADGSQPVSRKSAMRDLLCTCFFNAAAAASNATGIMNGNSDWIIPDYCRQQSTSSSGAGGQEPDAHDKHRRAHA